MANEEMIAVNVNGELHKIKDETARDSITSLNSRVGAVEYVALAKNYDLNTLTAFGNYSVYMSYSGYAGGHAPKGGHATVSVSPYRSTGVAEKYLQQELWYTDAAAPYIRYCNNGTWSDWQEIAKKSEVENVATATPLTNPYGTLNYCNYSKVGKLVTVEVSWTPNTDYNSGSGNFAKLPSSSHRCSFNSFTGNHAVSGIDFMVTESGNMSLEGKAKNGTTYIASFSYIAQ